MGGLPCIVCKDYRCVPAAHMCRGQCMAGDCSLPRYAPRSEFREYKDSKAFDRDRGEWLRNGWRVTSVSDVPQRAGVARFATLGLGALVLKPKSHVYVVYEK